MVARVWREVEQGVTTNGYEVSFWVDENSIKLTVVMVTQNCILKVMELHTLTELSVQCMNYILSIISQ